MEYEPRGVRVRFRFRVDGRELEGVLVDRDHVEYRDVLGTWQYVGAEHVEVVEQLPATP